MALYEFFTSRNNSANVAGFVGQAGRLFYDGSNGVVKLSDGVTPGGTPIPITIASPTAIGGIKAGPGANVATDGTLTIDTSGLPLSIGNLQIENTTIKTLNPNEDLLLESNGTGNVVVIGELKVYKTDGDISTRSPEFQVSNDGQVTIRVATNDLTAGAVEIIGTDTGESVPPAVSGVMLHLTGNNNLFASQYIDGVNNFSNYIGRRYNGTSAEPTQVKAGNVLCRFSGTGYGTTAFPGGAAASVSMVALEDFTDTQQGAKIEFLAAPIGSLTRQLVANVTVADGITVTKAQVLGNLTVGGNIIGNTTTTTATIGELSVSGNITFNANINNAVTTGFNKNGGTAVANGRTGQITSLADAVAKGSAVTFTITNSYINNKDVVIINIASGGSIDAYSVSTTAVNNGNCQVTVTNNGSGSLSQALVFNFAVIKVV